MALSSASSLAFAVAGGMPADAREWITVDLAGHPTSGRRGYLVATEPLGQTGLAHELATQARDIILRELRRMHRTAPDEALGRAFASANGAVHEQTRGATLAGADQRVAIGATAIIFENQVATIAHVPPGQLILVEDGLVYAIPDLESWFPHYAANADSESTIQPEPLGFASWTSPLIAQTELRPGDTIVACTSGTGRAFAEEVVTSGFALRDLTYLHHRDPEIVLDAFRGVVIARDLSRGAAAVVSFPPMPDSAQIRTVADVGRRTRDRWRHGRARAAQWRPLVVPGRANDANGASEDMLFDGVSAGDPASAPAVTGNGSSPPSADAMTSDPGTFSAEVPGPVGRPAPPRKDRIERRFEQAQARLQRMADWSGPKWRHTWSKPSPMSQFGVPGAHGVDRYQGQGRYMGEPSWHNRLPRLPFIGINWIWAVLLLLAAVGLFGASIVRDRLAPPEVDESALVMAIDEDILTARDLNSNEQIVARLEAAQRNVARAREAGVTDDVLNPREQAITTQLDRATDVIRMSDLERIGTLPPEFAAAPVRGVYTPAGIFFVAGSLYQWQPGEQGDSREVDPILEQGDKVGAATVGRLWGLAFDLKGLYATDGLFVYMLAADSREWRAVQLERINDQPWKPGAIAAFDGAVYLLQPEYLQIYRFAIEDAAERATPRDWLVSDRERLETARDIAIDQQIYALLQDGRVLALLRGELQSVLEPRYVTPGGAESIVDGAATGYTYIALTQGSEGRIVAFDQLGTAAYQLKLPIGFTTEDVSVRAPFDGLQDVVVDESTGTIFIVNGDGIWTARYSLPALPERNPATPEAAQ